HKQAGNVINMVRCINHMAFDDLGKFRLIDEQVFGVEMRYYVKHDGKFEELQERVSRLDYRIKDFNEIVYLKAQVEEQLRRMAGDIVAVRLSVDRSKHAPPCDGEETVGIFNLADPDDYSPITGIKLNEASGNII